MNTQNKIQLMATAADDLADSARYLHRALFELSLHPEDIGRRHVVEKGLAHVSAAYTALAKAGEAAQ